MVGDADLQSMFHWTFLWMELWKLLPFLIHFLSLLTSSSLPIAVFLSPSPPDITSFSIISPSLFLLQGRPHLPTAAATPLGSVLCSLTFSLCALAWGSILTCDSADTPCGWLQDSRCPHITDYRCSVWVSQGLCPRTPKPSPSTPQVPTYPRAPSPSSCTTLGPFMPTEDWLSERLADSLQPRRYAWSIL